MTGIDVMTMPPSVASEFLLLNMRLNEISNRTQVNYSPGLDKTVDSEAIRLDTLWEVDDELVACIDALEKENLDSFTADDLTGFFKDRHCGDVLVRWSESEIAASTAEGKIPKLENWRDALGDKSIGLDSLMNLAGLQSFATDQKAMDERIRQVLAKSKKITIG